MVIGHRLQCYGQPIEKQINWRRLSQDKLFHNFKQTKRGDQTVDLKVNISGNNFADFLTKS